MRLIRIGASGQERPAAFLDGALVDISSLVGDIAAASLDPASLRELEARVGRERQRLPEVDLRGLRIGPPLRQPGKIVCVGLNYRRHAAEAGMAIPSEPILFLKAGDTVAGPHDPVLIPPASRKTDYEAELGVVIGKVACRLPDERAAATVIAGYTISNDVSEREYQFDHGGTWDKGKNCETFNPLGPWLVTTDEIPDPQELNLSLSVNGERRQESSTADMIFGVYELVRYISQFMTLYPGDVINTGTPEGVGAAFSPPRFLDDGDVVELEVAGLGQQRQVFTRARR